MLVAAPINNYDMEEKTSKEIREEFYSSLVKDKKELHLMELGSGGGIYERNEDDRLMELGTGGGIYEIIEGDVFHVTIGENLREECCAIVRNPQDESGGYLAKVLQNEMYDDITKLHKKYGEFSFSGAIVYAPPSYYDADGTVTIDVAKYHKSRLGHYGAIIISTIVFKKSTSHIDKEDCLAALKNYFNIYADKGFRCYVEEDMAVTPEYDNVVDIPDNVTIDDITNILLPKLVSTHKSVLNGELDIDSYVKGYSFTVDSKLHVYETLFSKDWSDKGKEYYDKMYPIISMLKEENGFWKSEEGVIEFQRLITNMWNDNDIPKGVRENYKKYFMDIINNRTPYKNNLPFLESIKVLNTILSLTPSQ